MGGTRVGRYIRRLAVISTLGGITLVAAPLVSGAAVPKRSNHAVDAQVQDAVATLVVERDAVDLRRDGKERFRSAKDGAVLFEGDTVRTDATGRATIQYTDKSFTRLDVDTEFTIVELTDDQGTRQTTGSVSVGRTWNRVEDLTESEGFKTEGAGATAAVAGTAYVVACLNPVACAFDGVVHDITLASNVKSHNPKTVDELQSALVTLGVVRDVQTMSLQEFYGNAWIQENLAIDAFLGYESPDWQKTVIVRTNPDGTVEVDGVVVLAPSTGGSNNGGGEPTTGGGTPPPSGGGSSTRGYGAGGGTNGQNGGASFGGGNQGHPTGNCQSQSAGQGHGHGKPNADPCLGG